MLKTMFDACLCSQVHMLIMLYPKQQMSCSRQYTCCALHIYFCARHDIHFMSHAMWPSMRDEFTRFLNCGVIGICLLSFKWDAAYVVYWMALLSILSPGI